MRHPSLRLRAGLVAAATAAVALSLVIVGRAEAAALLSDDFADGNAAGWSTSGGSWSVQSQEYRQSSTGADAKALSGSTTWSDYSVQAEVQPITFGSSARSTGIAARAQSTTSFYSLVLVGSGEVQLRRVAGGGSTVLASAATTVTPGSWYTLRLAASGSGLTGSVNGTQLVSATDSTFGTGRAGLVSSYTSAAFDDVAVFTGAAPPSSSATASPSSVVTPTLPPAGQADGHAGVNAMGQNGTTGGAGGPVVTVTTGAELTDYVGRPGPFTIRITGTINLSGMITVVANKTIVGVGANAHITGGGLQLGSTTRPGNNVIIRNIKFSDPDDDSISVTNSAHHVWIDHNEFLPGPDGSLDVKRQSTYVTVSWNRFTGTDKTMLLGHSDGYTADVGYLKVTYHHNFFDGANQRMPRVRFGEPVHVYNNYYRNIGLYAVASTQNAGVVVEGNYFDNVAFPCYSTSGYADSDPGRLVARNNIFVASGTCEAGGSVAEPSSYYPYSLTPAAQVPAVVTAGAGVGKV
jgi:pectate lyase